MIKGKLNLYNEDCMKALEKMDDNQFDLAIVDPPYGIGAGKMKMNNNNHEFKEWDNKKPSDIYFSELYRVSKNQIIWGGNYFVLPENKCFIIWDKKQPEGVSFAMCEYAWSSFESVPKVFYQFPSHVTQGVRIHPTQKPVQLYKWLLSNYAKEGQTILDTHLGSGSIAIACYDMGFDLTGYEIDKDYFEAMEKRVKQHADQLTLI